MNLDRLRIEKYQDWESEIDRIPYVKFPREWEVQVIPPFADAVVRFKVRLPSGLGKSIYLDSRDSLGYVGHPYWEVYPVAGDVERCDINDVDSLLKFIADETPENTVTSEIEY